MDAHFTSSPFKHNLPVLLGEAPRVWRVALGRVGGGGGARWARSKAWAVRVCRTAVAS